MSLEKIVARLAQKVERRFYGKYRGEVVDNADPEHLGRLKVKVPSVLGNGVVTGWAMPCVPYGGLGNQGFLFIPEVKAGVWVEFEEGDLEFPIWVGTFWGKPGGDSELPKPNKPDGTEESSVQDPPTRKIIKTNAGHTIQMEDNNDQDQAHVIIVEGKKGHVILMDKDGINIKDGANNTIILDSSGITCRDKSDNQIILDSQGIQITDKNGNTISMNASSGFPGGPGVAVNSGGNRICLDGLIDWLLQHQHVGNLGAPTPLFPANMMDLMLAKSGTPNGLLSTKMKVE